MNFGSLRAQCNELGSSDPQSDIDPSVQECKNKVSPYINNDQNYE